MEEEKVDVFATYGTISRTPYLTKAEQVSPPFSIENLRQWALATENWMFGSVAQSD